jgi:uncharacterized protein YjbJ (UPF0337 family)
MADLKTEGRFDQVRGKVRSTWGDVTDDDIDRAEGNKENLIGIIKEKTGSTIESIRDALDRMFGDDDDATEEDRPK